LLPNIKNGMAGQGTTRSAAIGAIVVVGMTERRASKGPGRRTPASAASEQPASTGTERRRAKRATSRVRARGRDPEAIVRKKALTVAPLVPEPTEHGVVTPANALPLFPDFVPDYEWVLGLVELPAPKGRRATVPSAALFLEAGSGLVVHVDLLAVVTAKAVGGTLRRAVERGQALGLRRPTRIRVGVPDHASLLAEAGDAGVELVVGPVPEVEEVLRTPGAVKAVALPTADEIDVWRGAALVTDPQLAAFFGAAEELRRGRFWRVLEGERSLSLRCSALGLSPAGAAVELGEPPAGLRVRIHEGSLSVRFDRASQLSPARRRELGELRFAPRRGPYQVLSPVGEDGRLRRTEPEDYDLATAALLATSRFGSEYGGLMRRVSLQALVARYSIRLGRAHVVEVEIGRREPEAGDR
jgi:hypothetical protein